jgi:hypothetical protein
MLRVFITSNLGTVKMSLDVRVWLLALIVPNAISLGIDAVDVGRCVRGDRGELI